MSDRSKRLYEVTDPGDWEILAAIEDEVLVPVEPDRLVSRIMELSQQFYNLGNHGDGLPRIEEGEARWLVDRLLVGGRLGDEVPVEPVGFLDLYSPSQSTDGASVESIRWHGPKKPGRYAIVRLEADDETS